MALFGRKKEENTAPSPQKSGGQTGVSNKKKERRIDSVIKERNISAVILRPRITEKAANIGEQNVYTFEVRRDATKHDVRDAVRELFKVTPKRINIVNTKPRRFFARMRNRRGIHPGMKKAYVYLKEGDTIDLV